MDKKPDQKILFDHRQSGKRFIPPMADLINEVISWSGKIVPELIWIALMIQQRGPKEGTDLALALAQAAIGCIDKPGSKLFAATSVYSKADDKEKEEILSRLASQGKGILIANTLAPIQTLYPQNPLQFVLTKGDPKYLNPEECLLIMKKCVEQMIPRRERPAMIVQATAVYLAGMTDVLKYAGDASPPELDAIFEYPETNASKEVAARVRATVTGLLGHLDQEPSNFWCSYFWNRGLEIDSCELPNGY